MSDFWPDRYPCPRCDKTMRGLAESTVNPQVLKVIELRDLTPQEAFAAFSGLGFPDEHICTVEVLLELFKEQPVRKLHGVNVRGSNCSVIEYIELWDGSKVFLGSSPEGAVVYRVSRPRGTPERLGLMEEAP